MKNSPIKYNNTHDVYLSFILIIPVMFISIFIGCPLTWDR